MSSENDGEKIYPLGYEPEKAPDIPDHDIRNHLLDFILKSGLSEVVDSDLFAVMAKRRSTRKFTDKPVETTKIDKIIAAADTAPTAGNFQGFQRNGIEITKALGRIWDRKREIQIQTLGKLSVAQEAWIIKKKYMAMLEIVVHQVVEKDGHFTGMMDWAAI